MDEILDIVNGEDIVIDQQPRSTVHQRGLWHRGVHVFLFTEDGKLLVQKRSADRKQYASLWDGSVSEHVKAGESYLEAAIRGMKEEMGVEGIALESLVKFRMNYGPNDNEISALYKGIVNPSQVKFDPVEIAEINYHSMDELRVMIESQSHIFCGWFVEILKWYWGQSPNMIVYKEKPRRHIKP